jgi:tetratricopeptide (TPR) repeat protein
MSEEAPEKDPKNAAHWEAVEEATELLHEERYTEALLELRRVIQADPTNPYAFYFLGVGLFEVGELEASRDAYRAALRLAPEYLGSRIGLSHVLRMGGDLREAIREGLQALSQAPGDADALYAVGLAYLARGDNPAARRYFEAFLEARPEYESAEEVRGILETMNQQGN